MNVQKIPHHTKGGPDDGPHPRIETGAVQFGSDWPGLFIRGDGAAYLAMCINTVDRALKESPEFAENHLLQMYWQNIRGYADLIQEDVVLK